MPRTEDTQYKQSFDLLCKAYIVKRIIHDREVLTLTNLRSLFVKLVERTEGLDVPNYRSHNLKNRLKAKFPELVFKENPGIGDIAYSSSLMAGDIVEGAVADKETTDTDTTDIETDDTDLSGEEGVVSVLEHQPTSSNGRRS